MKLAASRRACDERGPIVKRSEAGGVPKRSRFASFLGGLEQAESVDPALPAHARADHIAVCADLPVGIGRDVKTVIIVERGAAALQLCADSAVVAHHQV